MSIALRAALQELINNGRGFVDLAVADQNLHGNGTTRRYIPREERAYGFILQEYVYALSLQQTFEKVRLFHRPQLPIHRSLESDHSGIPLIFVKYPCHDNHEWQGNTQPPASGLFARCHSDLRQIE